MSTARPASPTNIKIINANPYQTLGSPFGNATPGKTTCKRANTTTATVRNGNNLTATNTMPSNIITINT